MNVGVPEVFCTRVVLLGFENVEVLDLCGPYEVFSVTAEALETDSFETHLAAPD